MTDNCIARPLVGVRIFCCYHLSNLGEQRANLEICNYLGVTYRFSAAASLDVTKIRVSFMVTSI